MFTPKFWGNRLEVNSDSPLSNLSVSFYLHKHRYVTVPTFMSFLLQAGRLANYHACVMSARLTYSHKPSESRALKLPLQSATAAYSARGCLGGAKRRQPNSICLLLSLVGLSRSQTLLPIWWQHPSDKPSLAPALSHLTPISANWLFLPKTYPLVCCLYDHLTPRVFQLSPLHFVFTRIRQ